MLVPQGLKSYTEGGQQVLTVLLCKQLQPPGSPKNPTGKSQPEPVPGGKEGEAKLCPAGARGQIPIQGSEVANPPPHPPLQQLLLALSNLLVSGIKFQH